MSCSDTRKLDEAVFYEGPVFTLKVVRFYQNLFLSYNGETFSVQCSSEHTAGYGGSKFTERGWYELGSGGAIGTKTADDVIKQVKAQYLIVDDSTLAIQAWCSASASPAARGSRPGIRRPYPPR